MWSPECTVGCNNSDWLVGHSRKGLTEQRVVGLHGGHHLLRHLLVVTLCLASSYVWGAWSRHTHIQFIIHCIHYTVSLMNAFIKAYHRHTMKYFSCKWTCSIVWSFFVFFFPPPSRGGGKSSVPVSNNSTTFLSELSDTKTGSLLIFTWPVSLPICFQPSFTNYTQYDIHVTLSYSPLVLYSSFMVLG